LKIWIFLPAFNEEESLRRLLPKLKQVEARLPGHELVIFVVDDGSSDGTAAITRDAAASQEVELLVHSINRGLGETERDGFEFLAARCADDDIIVRLDCDDTHEPEYIVSLVDKLAEGYDVVNTSRFQPGGYQKGVNWYRRGISRAANIFMKLLFGLRGIKDYSCGFRAYRGKLIRDAVRIFGNGFLQMRGFGFTSTLEIVVKLHLLGARFAEVPFGLRYDQKASESKMVSSTTMIGYFVMAMLYHAPGSGWRSWRRKLLEAYGRSTDEAAAAFAAIRRTKSIPSRFGA
jgi:dolichol-phosphate mannosyltransferase